MNKFVPGTGDYSDSEWSWTKERVFDGVIELDNDGTPYWRWPLAVPRRRARQFMAPCARGRQERPEAARSGRRLRRMRVGRFSLRGVCAHGLQMTDFSRR